ncbi:MAG: radical SAM protein, partial [Thermodesulfobacteriota bacterium]|nr:radical SAM protein [Thermodesulfobacteriota bacterium]
MKPFSLLIKPASADCNLRCRYCFYLPKGELFPQAKTHRMSYNTLNRLVSSYMATDQKQYTFVWQGGEPTLMGLNFFEKVIELQKEHGRDYAVVTNVLQTNGKLIDDKWAAFLSKYRFLVGVSLDGAQELHDQNRIDARGKGSHSDVLKGIESLRRHDVPFNILVLVSASNVTRGRETYQYLRRNDLFYHQYIPCVEFYETSKGPSAGHTISGKQWGSFMCEVF